MHDRRRRCGRGGGRRLLRLAWRRAFLCCRARPLAGLVGRRLVGAAFSAAGLSAAGAASAGFGSAAARRAASPPLGLVLRVVLPPAFGAAAAAAGLFSRRRPAFPRPALPRPVVWLRLGRLGRGAARRGARAAACAARRSSGGAARLLRTPPAAAATAAPRAAPARSQRALLRRRPGTWRPACRVRPPAHRAAARRRGTICADVAELQRRDGRHHQHGDDGERDLEAASARLQRGIGLRRRAKALARLRRHGRLHLGLRLRDGGG